jgi:heme/copper-type cytochrome/quinol oxidase subunit 3
MKINYKHPFHLVDPSIWPFFISFSALFVTFGIVLWMHMYEGGLGLLYCGLLILVLICAYWWRDVVREATFEGHHTQIVQRGLRYGMLLFIVSEVMFFFAFFWAFFHSSLSPAFAIGGTWPPRDIVTISPWGVPLLNTLLLLCSGFTLTWSHHSLMAKDKKSALFALGLTLFLAVLFTYVQLFEYQSASFGISDGIFGSVFYITTGIHGFHVIVGTLFLAVCAIRMYANHFSSNQHFGFEAAIWYWHFVDVVWLFLFVCLYWWSANVPAL